MHQQPAASEKRRLGLGQVHEFVVLIVIFLVVVPVPVRHDLGARQPGIQWQDRRQGARVLRRFILVVVLVVLFFVFVTPPSAAAYKPLPSLDRYVSSPRAAVSVLTSSIVTVRGPTPPGTGVR